MAFKPILFSVAMVEALLAGRKTMTRRIVKFPADFTGAQVFPNGIFGLKYSNSEDTLARLYPKYEVGDILWVREEHYRFGYWVRDGFSTTGKQKWAFVPKELDIEHEEFLYSDNPPADFLKYRAAENCDSVPRWYKRNSLFMPAQAARIFLEIKSIKAERINDISDDDATAEGIEINEVASGGDDYYSYPRNYMLNEKTADGWFYFKNEQYKESFLSLWESINGKESLEANDWVFAYGFERIGKPSNFIKKTV